MRPLAIAILAGSIGACSHAQPKQNYCGDNEQLNRWFNAGYQAGHADAARGYKPRDLIRRTP